MKMLCIKIGQWINVFGEIMPGPSFGDEVEVREHPFIRNGWAVDGYDGPVKGFGITAPAAYGKSKFIPIPEVETEVIKQEKEYA